MRRVKHQHQSRQKRIHTDIFASNGVAECQTRFAYDSILVVFCGESFQLELNQ